MNEASDTCRLDVIERFLENELTAAEQNSLESHLDYCDDCCDQLRKRTADAEQWSQVKENLGDAFDASSLAKPVDQLGISLDFLDPTDDPHMLGRFAGYEIAGVIGRGGMGIVLKGFDRALNRYVAIKALLPHYASCAASRKRFAREARAAAAVVHDHVVEIYGVSVGDDQAALPYLVMPYIRGESLQKRLDTCGALTTAETLRVSMQIASGLAAAHEQGLVHRDIKPANILLAEDVERVKITDFGLARAADDASLTRTGVITGTPQYMSPEQADGGHVTQQSDLFSLGSVMYSTCSGRIPFRATTPLGVVRRIVDDDPRPIQQINPDVPGWLCRIIEKLHAKDPDQRFESAGEVARVLKQCLAHVQQPDTVSLPAVVDCPHQQPSVAKRVSQNFLIGAFVMTTILILSAIGWTFWQTNATPAKAEVKGAVRVLAGEEDSPFKKRFTPAFANASEIGTLNVDIKRGSITVVGHDEPNIIVDLTVPDYTPTSTGSDGLRELRPNNLDFDITTTGNNIKVDSNSERYTTNLQITVPRNTNLTLDSYRDGKVSVSAVHGQLDARSFHNDIRFTECSGSANLWSYHGDLVASMNSVDGDAPLEFESYNGSIELSLPADICMNTQLRTGRGKLLTDFDVTEIGDPVQTQIQKDGTKKVQFDEFVRGTINGGGPVLKIETEHGDIQIRKRMPAMKSL